MTRFLGPTDRGLRGRLKGGGNERIGWYMGALLNGDETSACV